MLSNVNGRRQATLEADNISEGGLGLKRSAFLIQPEIGSLYKADFDFGKKSFPITFSVIHSSASIVGCRFNQVPKGFIEFYEDFFELELKLKGQFEIKGSEFVLHLAKGVEVRLRQQGTQFDHLDLLIQDFKLSINRGLDLSWQRPAGAAERNELICTPQEILHASRRILANLDLIEKTERLLILKVL